MSIFNSILSSLGFGDKKEAIPDAALANTVPEAIGVVDVVKQLDALASASSEELHWKVSIVDLLKILGFDSSFAARKALAEELACPADRMADSASMNMWLHKTVLAKIAANGGNIPSDLH
jgi:hypothetical protein